MNKLLMGAALAVGALAVAASPTASACSGATIESISSDGSIIELEDGSIWRVAPGDQSSVATWSSEDDVEVCDGGTVMIDTDDGSGNAWDVAEVSEVGAAG